MVDVKTRDADRFVKAPPRGVVAFLFYGTDPGLVTERGERLARLLAGDKAVSGEILRLDESDLSGAPDRLAIELRTIPMFAGRPIVRLAAPSLSRPEPVIELIDGEPLAGVLIVEAGNLKPDSKLRKAFAEAPSAAAIACYGDDGEALGRVVSELFGVEKIVLSPPARAHLLELLGADRALSRSEIEKLALYVGPGGEATIEDIDAIVGDASGLVIDDLVMATTAGESAVALRLSTKLVDAGESPQLVVLMLLRHLLRLHQLRSTVDSGTPFDMAMRGLRPPPHFRFHAALQRQTSAWTIDMLARAIQRAQIASRCARLDYELEGVHAERLIIDTASLAPGRR